MRILTIVNNLEAGGAQGSAKNASLAFIEQGQDVAVLAFKGGGARVEPLQNAGAMVFIGGEHPDAFARAVSEAAAWNPDVVHVHRSGHSDHSMAGILHTIRDAAAPQRVAVIETNIFGRVDRSADEAIYDVHMMLSRWCLWKWQQWARGTKPKPIGVVVPNIVRSDGFYPAGDDARRAFREQHAIPQDAIVFGRVGQPMRAKWSYDTFHAFRRFAEQRKDAWFIAVGLPKKYHEFLRTLDDVRRRIVVIDFLHGEEALRACYAALDVFLHSSLIGESFGLVLAEAMLCERPVITLSTPARDNSQLEVVGHHRGGLVAANVPAMVEAMHTLAKDAELRKRLGAQGRQWCLEHYDSPVVGQLMVRIAQLAQQHADHDQLAAALAREPGIVSHVSTEEIHDQMRRMIGSASPWQKLQMRLVHAPVLYRLWRIVRRWQRKARGPGDKQRMLREQAAMRANAPLNPPAP